MLPVPSGCRPLQPTFSNQVTAMKSQHYKLVTIADGKTDADAIRGVFAGVLSNQLRNDLVLVNYYDEVPVTYSSAVTGLEEDGVELSVHEHQALIMKYDKSTLIKSSHFHNGLGVHCYATYVNVPKKMAILHNFAYAQIRAERREAVRVKVRDKVPVLFEAAPLRVAGQLIDISGIGLSIQCAEPPAVQSGDCGDLLFTLAGATVHAPASFVRAKAGDSGTVCMFQMRPDRRNEGLISQFIYQRQVEIVRELKDMAAAG